MQPPSQEIQKTFQSVIILAILVCEIGKATATTKQQLEKQRCTRRCKDGSTRVYKIWEQYLARKVKRYEIRDKTGFSSYIISVIYHLLREN